MWSIGKFINQVKTEMKKVAWPSKQEIITSTVVVIVTTVILAIYIGACDVVLSKFVQLFIGGVF